MKNENFCTGEKNVPKLRFPEFSHEWTVVKLKDISEEIKRKKENIVKEDNILTISAKKRFHKSKRSI